MRGSPVMLRAIAASSSIEYLPLLRVVIANCGALCTALSELRHPAPIKFPKPYSAALTPSGASLAAAPNALRPLIACCCKILPWCVPYDSSCANHESFHALTNRVLTAPVQLGPSTLL